MNAYEEKQEAKRDKLQKRAANVRAEANAKFEAGTKALEAIPFGQPILIGHHSERSDRAYRGRAVSKIDKSFELFNKADQLESRADGIGTGGISSDDPDAISKLDEKLLKAEEAHALMVERNLEARENGQEKPYRSFELTNSRARINSITKRIEQFQRSRQSAPMQPKEGNGWKMYEDEDDNRIVIKFTERPAPDVCKSLRSYGFLWSPSRGAWVRKVVNARFAIDRAYQILSAL